MKDSAQWIGDGISDSAGYGCLGHADQGDFLDYEDDVWWVHSDMFGSVSGDVVKIGGNKIKTEPISLTNINATLLKREPFKYE